MEYNYKEIISRLVIIQNEYAKSVSHFARILGENQVTVNNYLREREPSLKIVFLVLEKFSEINPDWLLFGKGDMKRDSKTVIATQSVCEVNQSHNDAYVDHLVKENEDLRRQNEQLLQKYQEMSEKFVNTLLSGNRIG